MGIFQQFPYSNFHEMNLDQLIKIMREMQDEWENTKAQWASYKDFIDNYFANLDLDEETEKALRKLVADGSLNDVIDPVIIAETIDWLSDHITQPTTPAIDTSLTIAGAAADAKAAGDKISNNKYGIDYLSAETGSYALTLTPNSYYPYVDLPFDIKAGVTYKITFMDFESDSTPDEGLYLYDTSASQRIITIGAIGKTKTYRATADISDPRLIVNINDELTTPSRVKVSFETDENNLNYELNTNLAGELTVTAVAGTQIAPVIPVWADENDIIEVEVIESGVLAKNAAITFGYDSNGVNYANQFYITQPHKTYYKFDKPYDNCSLVGYVAANRVINNGTVIFRYKNLTKSLNEADRDIFYASPVEINVGTTANTTLNVKRLPIYGNVGDIIKIKLVDIADLTPGYNVVFAVYVAGVQTQMLRFRPNSKEAYFKLPANYDVNSLEIFASPQFVLNTGDITFTVQNITKAGIPAPVKKYNSFAILGDSYSSYKDRQTPNNAPYWYPADDPTAQGYGSGNNVNAVSEMWWYKLATETGLYLVQNESWSGSPICYDGYGDGGTDAKTYSFATRVENINAASVVFVFGGMNDQWNNVTIGSPQYSGWTDADLSQYAPALCKVFDNLRNRLIGTDIVFIIPFLMNSSFKSVTITICEHYNVPYIEMGSTAVTNNHPNETGMVEIDNAVKNFLENNITLPYYC